MSHYHVWAPRWRCEHVDTQPVYPHHTTFLCTFGRWVWTCRVCGETGYPIPLVERG